MVLPEAIRKLIPLLGSPIDGEVVAAVRAIDRVLKKEKLDWHDFTKIAMGGEVSRAPTPRPRPPPRPAPTEQHRWWSIMAEEVMDSGMILTRKEREFLEDMYEWSREPSHKQQFWLKSLRERMGYQER